MAVYVDDVRHQFGRMIMCHLWADTLEELLQMVDRIGVQRKWIQGHQTLSFGEHKKASWVHFDISLDKKKLALQYGAILTDKFGPVIHTRRLAYYAAIQRGNVAEIAECERRLKQVEELSK